MSHDSTAEIIDSDYLVVGAGAMGMAFVDTMLSDSDATITMVDRYHQPGGHWTTVYPYVRLHQPSNYYGVNSKVLGADGIDVGGWNDGLCELASGSEVCAYYNQVMGQTFLPSGRVAYYPKCVYDGNGAFTSLVTGKTYQVSPSTRVVDATYMRVTVPSMGPPAYKIGEGVQLVTPNTLALEAKPHAHYTVIGAGKTGMDACLWLLGAGVAPSKISWIMPRDPWLLDRGLFQPGDAFAAARLANLPAQVTAIHTAFSADDLLQKLCDAGQLLRLDDGVWPTMFHCATASRKEFEALKTITNVVRQGRVVSIDGDRVSLEQGSYAPEPDTLFVDCSASGVSHLPAVSIFADVAITLQPVRFCQQVFSAAFIAHVETTYPDREQKNALCRPIPHPGTGVDWLAINVLNQGNQMRWNDAPKTVEWLERSRLEWFRHWVPPLPEDPREREGAVTQRKAMVEGMCAKLETLIDTMAPEDKERVRAQISGLPSLPTGSEGGVDPRASRM